MCLSTHCDQGRCRDLTSKCVGSMTKSATMPSVATKESGANKWCGQSGEAHLVTRMIELAAITEFAIASLQKELAV